MAIRQTLQLEELNYEYELFRENQLLTHEQLNKFIRYFEDQDRLTRTCLIGVGLVCGLTTKLENNVLTVSQGCAVTTDGDLIKLETTDYKFFKEYSNLTRGKGDPIYDPFFPPAANGTQVKLWELLENDQVEPGNKPPILTDFKTVSGTDITDMVALLYLEYYLAEPDDCTSIDCDHLGQLQHARIKVLLISQQDMDKVINSEPTEVIADHIYKSYYEAYEKYFVLPELKAQRLPMTSLNTASLGALTKGYANIIANGNAELINAIEDLYTTFQFILDPAANFKITEIKNKLNTTFTTTVKPFQIQYLYDFYKDLIDGYNEIRDTIYNAIYICCPDKYAFPKHIMLGIVNVNPGSKPLKYRHHFYSSPAISKNKTNLSKAKSMFTRLVNMNIGFTLPAQPTTIRITPSVDADKLTEKRAIPFYYKNAADLRKYWSYGRTARGTDKNLLSYYSLEYGENNATKNPLDYDLDKNNFFRIEGHMGKKMKEAMEAVLDIKENKSLPFDVVAVRMDDKQEMEINLDDYSCQFDDLNAILNSWIVEQDCLYAKTVKFFSSFNSTGKNIAPVKTGVISFTPKAMRAFQANQSLASELSTAKAFSSTPVVNMANKNFILAQNQYYYQVDDTVDKNLSKEKDTIGDIFKKNIKPVSVTGDTYISLLLQYIDLNKEIWKLTSDTKEIAYNIPVRLIARINDVTRYKPFEIKDLNTDILEDYKKAIDTLCDEAELSRTKAETIFAKADYAKQGYEPQYLNALVELTTNCCAADKLKVLMDEIEKRKQNILESLSFARYAAQHTGLEHKAGVHRGGTFVVLYASVVTQTGRTLQPGLVDIPGLKSSLSEKPKRDISDFYKEDEDTFLLELVNRKEELDTPVIIKEYTKAKGFDIATITGKVKINALFNKANLFAAALAVDKKETVSNEMVVADFCIPYICCSDCPPMVFIMPKQKFSLALPKAVACNDEPALVFQKEPADGKVVVSAGFEATVEENNGITSFNPAKVQDEESFGKEITFTINGQVTDCVIKVFKHPVAKFSWEIKREDNNSLVVLFTNESDGTAETTRKIFDYEWNFGGKQGIKKVGNKEPITITYDKSDFGTAASFKVTLKVTHVDSPCEGATEQTIPITPKIVKLSFENDKVCEDVEKVGFVSIEPADGVPKCKEFPQAVILEGTNYSFFPTAISDAMLGTPLHFTVNEQDVPATITVFAKPDATFSVVSTSVVRQGDDLSFTIKVKTPVAALYKLAMGEFVIGEELTAKPNGLIQIPNLNIKGRTGKVELTLGATNGDNSPCQDSTGKSMLTIPENIPVINCTDVTLEDLKSNKDQIEAQLRGATAVTNPKLIDAGKRLFELYNFAVDRINEINNADIQTNILKQLTELMNPILEFRMEKESDKTMAGLLLRTAMVLATDTVRCTPQLSPDPKTLLSGILDRFINGIPNAASFFVGFDKDKVFTQFIKKLMEELVSKDTDIIKQLKKIVTIINTAFP